MKHLVIFSVICSFCWLNIGAKNITSDSIPKPSTQTSSTSQQTVESDPNVQEINSEPLNNSLRAEIANPQKTVYRRRIAEKCYNCEKSQEKQICLEKCIGIIRLEGLKPSFWIFFISIWVCGVLLAWRSAICRDISINPSDNKIKPFNKRPFSMAKVQLFWWTSVILSCYVAVFAQTLYLVAITPSIILLLGMGLGVAVIGQQITNVQREKRMETTGVPLTHQDVSNSQGFFIDILSDDNGISIHRFQILIFNLIYGIGFMISFFYNVENLLFPFIEFEMWQLVLLGVSAAGYLGMKSGENSSQTEKSTSIEAVEYQNRNKLKGSSANEGTDLSNSESVEFQKLRTDLESHKLI